MMPCSNNAAGYYHYATGSNESYEETLPKVKAAIRICQTVGKVDFLNQNATLNISWEPKNGDGWKMILFFKQVIFGFHGCIRECKELILK